MKRFAKLTVSALAVMALACAAFMMTAALAFAADPPQVRGADGYSASGSMNLLSVDGTAGDTIFVEVVQADGKILTSRNAFTLKGQEATGVVTFNLDTFTSDDAYTVRAYADRAQSKLLYEGTLVPVLAKFDGSATKIIGSRVVSTSKSPVQDSARSFMPEETLYINGENFRLQRDSAGSVNVARSNNVLTFSYVSYSPSKSVTGSISYVDDAGTVVYTQTIPGITSEDPQPMPVPSAVKAQDGTVYRTVCFYENKTVTAYYFGQRDFVIHVKKLDTAAASALNYYVATINLVDEAGTVLATDSVSVTGTYTYTAPTSLYVTSNGQNTSYTITDSTKQVLNLDAQNDNVTDGAKTYTITYTKQVAAEGTVNVQFNLVNGTKRVEEKGRTFDTESATITSAQQEVTPTKYETHDIDGETYVIAGGASLYTYGLDDYKNGKLPVVDVYYVPKDYVAPGAYDVTVQYVNLANDSVITTKTYTAKPDQTEDLEIATDSTVSADGADYVRLDGQEDPIYHYYYSSARMYTVYYRNVNDDLTANTVITRIRVSYEGGTTTPIATTETTATTAGTLTGELNDGRTYNSINGNDGGLLTNEQGTDTNTERIEEEQTPLASGTTEEGQGTSFLGLSWPLTAGIGAAVAAGIIALLVIFIRKRRKSDAASAE